MVLGAHGIHIHIDVSMHTTYDVSKLNSTKNQEKQLALLNSQYHCYCSSLVFSMSLLFSIALLLSISLDYDIAVKKKHDPPRVGWFSWAFLQADAVSTFSGSDGLREICDLTGAGGEIVGCRGCVGRCGGYHSCPKNPGLRYREDGIFHPLIIPKLIYQSRE